MVTSRPHLTLHHPSAVSRSRPAAEAGWWHELLWIAAAALLGFAVTMIFSSGLELSRSWLVAIYAPAVFVLTAAYVYVNEIDLLATLQHRWRWGVGIGIVFAALLILTVERQEASARPEGWQLAFDVAWLGVVYGAADALLLNILPVMAVWRVFSHRGWTQSWRDRIGVGALALAASLIVTIAYHAGFPEYQSGEMRQPVIGNTINTLAYILANNPIASLISHIAMHIAAVFQGAETTVQLPPHY
jgi:hypothetical protein